MELGNAINVIAILITLIGIVVGLVQLSRSNGKDSVGSFVSFRLETNRRCNAIMTRTIQICGLVVLVIYISESVMPLFNLFTDWPFRKAFRAFESVLIWAALLSSFVLNQTLSFKDFKRIDRWIKKNEMPEVLAISFQYCGLAFSALYLIAAALNLFVFGSIGTPIAILILVLCVFVIYISFLRTYFRLRTLYEVSDMRIILRDIDYEYHNIHNYRHYRGSLIFVYDDGGVLKKIQTDEKNVLLIEQVINLETTLKDIKLSTEVEKRRN